MSTPAAYRRGSMVTRILSVSCKFRIICEPSNLQDSFVLAPYPPWRSGNFLWSRDNVGRPQVASSTKRSSAVWTTEDLPCSGLCMTNTWDSIAINQHSGLFCGVSFLTISNLVHDVSFECQEDRLQLRVHQICSCLYASRVQHLEEADQGACQVTTTQGVTVLSTLHIRTMGLRGYVHNPLAFAAPVQSHQKMSFWLCSWLTWPQTPDSGYW